MYKDDKEEMLVQKRLCASLSPSLAVYRRTVCRSQRHDGQVWYFTAILLSLNRKTLGLNPGFSYYDSFFDKLILPLAQNAFFFQLLLSRFQSGSLLSGSRTTSLISLVVLA
jgi:hypothetical protein